MDIYDGPEAIDYFEDTDDIDGFDAGYMRAVHKASRYT
jgi:hypothetical protein